MAVALNLITHAEVIVSCTLIDAVAGPKTAQNVFHLRRIAVVNDPVKTAVMAAMKTAWIDPWLAAAADQVTAVRMSCRWMQDPNDPAVEVTPAGVVVGQVASDAVPNQNTASFLLRTALKGKRYRGAKRFAGVPEAHTTRGVLTGAGLVLWQALQTALGTSITDATPNTWKLCVVSRANSDFEVSPCVVSSQDVTQILLNKTCGSQDSRRADSVHV